MSWSGIAPTDHESVPSPGLSRSTHQPPGSRRTTRLIAITPLGSRMTTSPPTLGLAPWMMTTRSPSRRVGNIERPRTIPSPTRFVLPALLNVWHAA